MDWESLQDELIGLHCPDEVDDGESDLDPEERFIAAAVRVLSSDLLQSGVLSASIFWNGEFTQTFEVRGVELAFVHEGMANDAVGGAFWSCWDEWIESETVEYQVLDAEGVSMSVDAASMTPEFRARVVGNSESFYTYSIDPDFWESVVEDGCKVTYSINSAKNSAKLLKAAHGQRVEGEPGPPDLALALLASHASAPDSVLRELAADPIPEIRQIAGKNPSATEETRALAAVAGPDR